jgi:hypothetical protein
MPTGTPPPPSSELIDRFNVIIDDVMACLAVESMRAAGVPWLLRIILAPLLRRRIARWSARFAAIVADARAGRCLGPAARPASGQAIGPAADFAGATPQPDNRSGALSATERDRPASGRRAHAVAEIDAAGTPDATVALDRRAMRTGQRSIVPRGLTNARIPLARGRGRAIAPRTSLRGGASACGPPVSFGACGEEVPRTDDSFRIRNGRRFTASLRRRRPQPDRRCYRACALASLRVAPARAASAAAMNASSSPSSTASGFPVSTPVRRSFTSWYGAST